MKATRAAAVPAEPRHSNGARAPPTPRLQFGEARGSCQREGSSVMTMLAKRQMARVIRCT